MAKVLLGVFLLLASVLTLSAAEPLFREDFESGAAGMPHVFCGVDQGSYLVEIQTTSHILDVPIPGDLSLADFRLDVTVRLEESEGQAGYGIYFRDSETGGYEIELSPSGDVFLWHYDEGGYDLLLEYQSVMWVRPVGEENRLILVCRDEQVSLWINEHKVLSYANATREAGGLGLWAGTYDASSSIRIRFDDLAVWSLP